MKRLSATVYVLAVNLAGLAAAHAETWLPLRQSWVGLQGVHLGSSIAVGVGVDAQGHPYPNRVYVGEPDADDGAMTGAGDIAVYVPSGQGWSPSGVLFASSPQAGAHFGASLAYGSGHLLVGAPGYNSGAGYVEFFFDNGAATPNIASRGFRIGNGGNFGASVAVNVDMAAVGIPNAGSGDGCVAAFHYNLAGSNWVNLPTLNDVVCGSNGEELGASVAILRTGDATFLLVAGAPGETQNNNTLAGGAHVFFPNPDTGTGGFVEVGTLAAQSPTAFDVFGTSVGIDANYVYVGATGRDNGVGRVGSVTIFKPATIIGYNYLSEYFPSPPATIGGHCGASLSVDVANAQFILGCPDSTGTVAHEGTARVYRRIDFLGQPVWLESVLDYETGNLAHGADALGSSVAIFGNAAFAGAPNVNFPAPQTGNGSWKEFVPDKIFGDGFE